MKTDSIEVQRLKHTVTYLRSEVKLLKKQVKNQKPLSPSDIKALQNMISMGSACFDDFDFVAFVRLVEERHGIE